MAYKRKSKDIKDYYDRIALRLYRRYGDKELAALITGRLKDALNTIKTTEARERILGEQVNYYANLASKYQHDLFEATEKIKSLEKELGDQKKEERNAFRKTESFLTIKRLRKERTKYRNRYKEYRDKYYALCHVVGCSENNRSDD
jgi:chromosome segregation ATPase